MEMDPQYEFISTDPQGLLDRFSTEQLSPFDVFMNPNFMKLHVSAFPTLSYAWVEKTSKKLLGLGHFSEVEKGFFRSPGRGSYGGLQFVCEREIQDHMFFAKRVEDDLKQKGAHKIEIIQAPDCYASSRVSEWTNTWHQLGFKIEKVDLNYSIPVGARPFADVVVHAVRKRVNKCRRENFIVQELPIENLSQAYEVIRLNREARGFPLTMTLEQLGATAQALPGKIKLFGVFSSNQQLVASAIVYEITPKIDYVFYWGDLPGHSDYSFVTLLAEFLYQRAFDQQKSELDLGISTVHGVPNPGLVKFKTNLGATASLKLGLTKYFA
jgi:hypothetical protein